jgi:prepilin-type N-terminal cleavage/methylation domain-containing protein
MTAAHRRHLANRGYTLIEVLITVALIGILFAIATPLFLDYRTVAHVRAAESDVSNVGRDVMSELAGYMTFGTTNGTITVTGDNVLQFTNMNNALPYSSGPGLTTAIVTLSANSTFAGGTFGSGGNLNWCVSVANNGQYGVYTEKGLTRDVNACNADGTAYLDPARIGNSAPPSAP